DFIMENKIRFLFSTLLVLITTVLISNYAIADTVNSTKKIYNIEDYGAIGNGKFINTKAIQRAIDTASNNGSGEVLIPKGVFLTGSIILKSGVELHLQPGAILLGSIRRSLYKRIEYKNVKALALILAFNAKNISITGNG